MTESSPYRDTPAEASPTVHVCRKCIYYCYSFLGREVDHECAATERTIPREQLRISLITGKPVYRKAQHVRMPCAQHRRISGGEMLNLCPDFIPKEPTWLHRVWAWLRGTR